MSNFIRKFIQFTLILLLIIPFLSKAARADLLTDCEFHFYDSPDLKTELPKPNQNMGNLIITMGSTVLRPGDYNAQLVEKGKSIGRQAHPVIKFDPEKAPPPIIFQPPSGGWPAKTYTLKIVPSGISFDHPSCIKDFDIVPLAAKECSTQIENSEGVTNALPVTLVVNGLKDNHDCYDIVINNKIQPQAFCSNGKDAQKQNLGTFDAKKKYFVELKNQCMWFGDVFRACQSRQACNPTDFFVNPYGSTTNQQPACRISPDPGTIGRPITNLDNIYMLADNLAPNTTFNVWGHKQSDQTLYSLGNAISDVGGNFSFQIHKPQTTKRPTSLDTYEVRLYDQNNEEPPICTKLYTVTDADKIPLESFACPTSEKGCVLTGVGGKANCGDSKNPGVITAIGCVHTNPSALVKDVMTFVVGISGGLSFLLMLLGAFQMLSSAGNPETLQAGRDKLTSAIIGLLLVIFAVLLMQIIGIGILNLPGFKL